MIKVSSDRYQASLSQSPSFLRSPIKRRSVSQASISHQSSFHQSAIKLPPVSYQAAHPQPPSCPQSVTKVPSVRTSIPKVQQLVKLSLKGTLPWNIFILKSGHKGHINSLNIGGLNKFFNFFVAENAIWASFWSLKICLCSMCEAKSEWLPSMWGAKSALLPSMCGAKSANLSHTDFVPHMKQRHSFRDQIIAKTASFSNFQIKWLKTTNI